MTNDLKHMLIVPVLICICAFSSFGQDWKNEWKDENIRMYEGLEEKRETISIEVRDAQFTEILTIAQ